MVSVQHVQLPERRPERVAELRVVDVRAVHAVERAVLRRQQRLELRIFRDEAAHEVERAQRGRGRPVQRRAQQALCERG